MAKEFRRDYGVFCCPHVFRAERPVLYVVRDPDSYWQFLCGQDDEDFEQGYHVDVGHLLERDPGLEGMADLEIATVASRSDIGSHWRISDLDDEE